MQVIDGKKQEPIEHVVINVNDDLTGTIIELLSNRKALMTNMFSDKGITTLHFDIPTR